MKHFTGRLSTRGVHPMQTMEGTKNSGIEAELVSPDFKIHTELYLWGAVDYCRIATRAAIGSPVVLYDGPVSGLVSVEAFYARYARKLILTE